MKQSTSLHHCLRLLLFSTCLLLLVRSSAQNNKPVYVSFTYLKTAPGKYNDYLQLAQTLSKGVFQYEIRQKQILGWYLYEVLMPSGTEAGYNMVGVTVSYNIQDLLDPAVTGHDLLQKAFPQMTSRQMDSAIQQLGAARSIVKREIYMALSGTNEDEPPSKYAEIDYMTPAQGKAADYVKMEETKFLPIHKQRMALGVLKGWRLAEKVMPVSTNDPYSYITANFYDNIDRMMDGKYPEAIKKAWPTEDITRLSQQVNMVKKGQANQLWKLVEYEDQHNAK